MRSLLFVPADSDRKLAKSLTCGADALILDLEDSVTSEHKDVARSNASKFLNENLDRATKTHRMQIYVRINDLQSSYWRADLDAVVAAGPDGIMLPKPRSGADVAALSAALRSAEQQAGRERTHISIIAIATETPGSLLNMASYIGASPRLTGLCWGAEDLGTALGAQSNRDGSGRFTSPYLLARNLCLVTAAAAEVQAIDTVFTEFRNDEGLRAEAEEAARDGFTGKLAIHPAQVPIINEMFTPSAANIEMAQQIVAAFKSKDGKGAVSLNGRMLDRPHLVQAQKLLTRAALTSSGNEA